MATSRKTNRSELALRKMREFRSVDSVDSIPRQLAERAAASSCTLLIAGETGSGKGHLARWIHDNSPRRDRAFVPINCGAIPEHIIDSQLFGHKKGAFSGATADHIGLVRAAEKGTLLLDEISELPLSAQTRLLRLLQEREVQPVGQSRPVVVDVRVLAATNIDLQDAVAAKTFREDLLFRLDVIRLDVKPLRQRTDEIPALVEAFNAEFATFYRQSRLDLEPDAVRLLMAYHWPGNIRQLRSVIERLHVLTPGEPMSIANLIAIGQLHDLTTTLRSSGSSPITRNIEDIKLAELQRVLAETGGSVAKAAAEFGVHRSTIYRWLKDHQVSS